SHNAATTPHTVVNLLSFPSRAIHTIPTTNAHDRVRNAVAIMMRDPRRRSPESSRRRRRERRDSREQLAASSTVSSMPGPSAQPQPQPSQQYQQQPLPQIYSQSQYPQSYADPQRYPEPERYAAHPERYDDPQRYAQPQPQQHPQHDQYPPTEAFVNPLGYTEQQPYVESQGYQGYREPERMRPRGGSSSSSSSSTSSSLLNISAKSPKFGGVFSTFFRAPSEQRKRRRRKKQMARILSFGNSSSSSVNSDLAYGRGYIERDKSQRASPRPQGHPSPALHRSDAANVPQRPPPAPRDKTDEEILEIGRQLQDIARKQNQADLKATSKSRASQIAGAAAAAAAFSHFRPKNKSDSKTRGSGTSKPNENGSSSDDDWESASEDESTTDESDNGLVYGSVFKPAKSARISSEPPEQIKPPERKSTIVDPRLFGPVNSLRGAVKSPCGFGEEDPRSAGSSRRHHEETIAQVESPKSGKQPMQRIYPVPTSDPDRFDYDRSSVTSSRQDLPQRARPEPVPIQQPIPIVPVSSKVYDAERFEEDERTKQRRPPPKGRSAAENAIAGVGVAAAAIGAAMASNRRDSGEYLERRDDRRSEVQERREDPHDSWQSRRKVQPEQTIRVELDDRETRKPDDHRRPFQRNNADVIDERDKKRVGRSDPAYEALKRREAEPDPSPEVYRLPQGDEIRVEYDPNDDHRPREEPKEPRRDDRKPVFVDERRETMQADKPTELPRATYGVEQPEAPSTQAPIDPFQFQVADDAFQTPKYATPKRPLTPQVVTVDREPKFDDSPPRKPDYSESRMSRKDSFELEQRLERYQQGAQDRSRTPGPHRRRDSIEEEEHAAKLIYDEAKHATVPIAAAAVASAIAVEEERSRKHRHDQTTEDGSRNRTQAVKDAVQEEADRYYRETVIARKIAKDEMRSRSSSPHDQSVVGKWQEHDDGPEIVTIVTPPEMDHHHDKSPYDAPNADVRIDHVIIPEELSRFRLPGHQLAPGEVPTFQSRDPSCERERPLLNLVLPTPVVTPRHTPAPEQQREPRSSSRTQEAPQQRSVEPADAPSSEVPATEIVLGPKGEVVERPTTPSAKSVTWGENETKSFNIESPEPPKKTASSTSTKSKKKKKLGKSSPWGIISAAVGSGAAAAAVVPEMRDPFESKPDEDRERQSPPESPKSRGNEPLAEPTVLPASPKLSTSFEDEHDLPPAPGPKPSSPQTSRMPGAFADDLEFASVLAAGLQDTGFDPNIVIDNPTYMRRDSPPGQSEPAVYQQPFAETVTDLGIYGPEGPASTERGFVIGEVPETPVAERDLGDDHATESPRARERLDKGKGKAKETPLVEQEPPVEEVEPSRKLSKKEKRKQKAAKRQSMDNAPADETYDTPETTLRPEPTPFSETAPSYERPRNYYDVPGATPQDGPASFADSGPVYDRPHTYYGVPEPTPLSGSRPYSDAVSAHDRPHSYYGVPEMTSRNEPIPFAETAPYYERPHNYYDTPQSPETVVALGPKNRGFQDVPTWDLPASSDIPRSYGETLASAASASETAPADYEPIVPSKSSKKEKKKKSRSSRSEVIVVQEDEDEPPNERSPRDEPSTSRETQPESDRYRSSEPQETGEQAWETLAKKKSKKSKQSSDEWTDVEKQSDYTPTVERSSTRDDLGDWDDLPPKSHRDRSRLEDRDVSSVASDPSSRREMSDRRSKSSRREDRDASSVVSDPSSRRDKSERRSHSSRYDDRDVSSVVSDPATRSEKSERRSKSIRDEERDTSSVVSDRSSRREKTDRRSNGTRHEDGDDAKSVASGSSSRKRRSDDQKSPKEEEKRSSGFFNSLFRGGNSRDASGKDEKSSFLDNAGTLGAGAGLASAVAALGSMMSRSNATEPQLEKSANVARSRERSASPARDVDIDPEIVPRIIRPAIDPQYGDFLPLPPSPMPPSTPGSPTQELEELPALPDSRPETPPEERRRQHETKTPKTHTRKRSNMETPTRSPSQTAVPFKLRLGQRSTPSSPGTFGVSPVSSPTVPTAPDVTHVTPPTPASHARRPSRPISWESSREIKPLYLLEQARQESAAQSMEPPIDFPELPPSEPSSRESPAPEFSLREDDVNYFNQLQASPFEPTDLRIDTGMSQYPAESNRHFGSQETTPKAEHAVQHTGAMFGRASPDLPELSDAAKQLGLSEHELEELPALPASPLASPVVPDVVGQSDFSQPDLEQLPALPDSPPDSPAMRPVIGPAETISQERSLYGPASPALPIAADTDRHLDLSQTELDGLPALPASPLASPTTDVADSLQQPDIPTSKPEELPALPDSPAAYPTAMPEPEPVETTSKERSSYLLHMTPPSIIKNLMDRDTPDTPPSPTLNRPHDTTVATAEIEEQDLSGSHKAALGALVGGAAAGLAAASLIDHARTEDKAIEAEPEDKSLETFTSAEPPVEGKKSKKDKKKKKKAAKGASIDSATLPSADIAAPVPTDKNNLPSIDIASASPVEEETPVSNEAARSMPTDEQATPLPPIEHVPSTSVGHDESLSVDTVPTALIEDATIAPAESTMVPSIGAVPSASLDRAADQEYPTEVPSIEVSSAESTGNDLLPPLPSVSAEEEVFLSNDTDLSVSASENTLPSTQDNQPLEPTEKAPLKLADPPVVPADIDQATATGSPVEGDILVAPDAAGDGEVAGPTAAELLAEDTAGGKKLSKKERKKLLKIKKAWEQAQAEMQELERSAESNEQNSKAASDTDAPLTSLPEPDKAAETNEVEEAAAIPLPDVLDPAEEEALLKPEETTEKTQAEQATVTQLPAVLEPAFETSLPEPEKVTKTTETEQAAAIPLPEISEPAIEASLNSLGDAEKAKDVQEPEQPGPAPALKEPIGDQEESQNPLPDSGSLEEANEAGLPATPTIPESLASETKKSKKKKKKGKKAADDEPLTPSLAPEAPPASSLSVEPAPENEEKPLRSVDDVESENQAPVVVDQENSLLGAEQAQESQQGLVTEVAEVKSSTVENNSSNQQLPLPPSEVSEEKTVEPIEVSSEPQNHPLELVEKPVEPSDSSGEQQTALQDQDDRSVEQDVISSELQSLAPAQETSLKLDDDSQEQQTSAAQPIDVPATTDSQQEQPVSNSEVNQTAQEPTVESREVEEPTETSSASLSKKQKKKLKKARKSLNADDETLAAFEAKPTEPQSGPVANQVPETSNLDTVPNDANISEALPTEPVVDTTTAAAPVEQAVEDASRPVHTAADAAAVPLPEDATETFEEMPKEAPKPVPTEVASEMPLPDDTPAVLEEASEPALAEPVASAVPVSEDVPVETNTTAPETSDNVPTVIDNGETPTSEPAPVSVEAHPAESVQPESSGKKKKKKKKGKGALLSQLDDVMSAETTPLQSPGVQTPTTEAPVGEPFDKQAPATDHRTIDTSIVESSTNEAPAAEIPSVETPAVETPVAETPVVQTQGVETLPVETSSGEPLSIGADTMEATSSAETPTAESAPSDGVLTETLAENLSVDESIMKTQPIDIVSTEAQQTEEASLQANEPGLFADKAAVTVDIPETLNSSSIPDEQIETPAVAEETSKVSKKSKKKKKKDKKAVEADPEAAAVIADDVPAEPLDATPHNLPADEKAVETDRADVQEPVVTVNETESGDVNVTDFAAEETLNAESQTPTMADSQDEAFVTPPQVPATPENQVEAPENLSQEPTLVESQIDSFDTKPQEPLADEEQGRSLDSQIEPEASASSKKSKKKAKKAAAAAAAIVLEPTTEDAAKDSDDKKEAKDETITDDGISNTISDKTGEMEQSSQEPPTSGEFATDSKISEEADPGPTVTKKGKKKKKGKKSSTLDLEPENSPSTSTLETTADVANTREQSAYITSPSGEPSSDEIPFPQADPPTEAEWPASATASKKRKSVTWAPELESFSASPEPPLLQEDEGPLEDLNTTETVSVSETPLEAEPQLSQDESVAGDSPEATTHGELMASQGIDIDQTATSEAEEDLNSEGQAQMRHPASEPSEPLSGLEDTTPNPGNHFPSSSGLDTTRGIAGEPIVTQQTHSPSDPQILPTPASSSMDDVEVANRKGGETLSREVDAEQVVSAEADATTDPEPAGRPDTIDEPSAGANTQTGEVGIQDPGLHVDVGAASGLIDDKSLGDTQNGRIADAQPVGPALTDSALEAGDPQNTPVIALANQATNMEIPQPLDHVPNSLEVGKISEAGITDASTAENLLLEDEQRDKISNVENKEEAEEAKKDEKEDSHDPLATDAGFPGKSDNSESLGEPIASEPQLEPLSETLPGPEPTGDVSTTQGPDQTETQAGQEDDVRSESSSSSKMSKKDKKSKKKTKAASAEPVPQDDVQDLKKQIVDDGAPAVRVVDEPVQAPEQAGPEPSPEVTNALEVAPVTEAVEAGEDEWAVQPAGKKSKKDKKKRAAAEAAAVATEQSNKPAPETSEVSIEAEVPSQLALDKATEVGVVSDQQPTPVDTTEASSNAPEVQESKEGQEDVDREVHTPSQPTTNIPGNSVTTNEELGAPEEADAAGFEPAKKSKKDKKKKKKQSSSLVDSQELASPTTQPEESESPEGTATSAPPHDAFLPNTDQKTADDVPPSSEAAPEDTQKTANQDESILKSEEAPAAQGSTTTELIEAPAADNSEAIPELPLDQLDDTSSAPQAELKTLGDSTTPLQEEEFPAVTKKSKKDKKKKGLASSTPDEAPATPEPESGFDQPKFSAADQTSEPSVAPPETPIAEEQSPEAVEEAISAEAAPTTESPLTLSERPVIEEQASTPAEEEAPTSKKSKKDKTKKKVAPVDTPEEQLPTVEAEAVPELTTVTQAAETLDEPALPAIEETTLPKDASVEEPALAPETTQPMEKKPIEAEAAEDKPTNETPVAELELPKTEEDPFADPFAGLSKKQKKKKMAEMEKAAAEAEAAVAVTPTVETEKTPEETTVPESTQEPLKAEEDPFAGLSKKQKKKKMAEMAAAAEAEATAAATAEGSAEGSAEVDQKLDEETPSKDKLTEQSSIEELVKEEPVIGETVIKEPVVEEQVAEETVEEVSHPEAMSVPNPGSEVPEVEKDPFAGLSKKQKKKKMAEMAAAAEKAAAEAAAEAEQKSAEKPFEKETPVEDKLVAENPLNEKPLEEIPTEDKPADEKLVEEPSAPETPQVEEDPLAGLSKKEKKKLATEMTTAAAVSEPTSVEATQTTEEEPAGTAVEDKVLEERPFEVVEEKVADDKPAEENVTEQSEPEPPIVEKDPFAGLSKKQKKKKMAEMAAAAAAAATVEAAATEANEVIEEKPADSKADTASAQAPALESDPSASVENVSKEDSLPEPIEKEALQSAEIANPEDEFPVPEKKSKKDKKKKGKPSQSDPVVELNLEPSVEQQPEPELQEKVPSTTHAEVENMSLEAAQSETAPSDEAAGSEGAAAKEQLPTVEEAALDQQPAIVQPADPEQEFPLTGNKTKKAKKKKGLTELESKVHSPTVTVPQGDESPAVEVPSTENTSADQTAVVQPEDLPVESQTRSVDENQPDAPATPGVNAEDEFPLAGKKAKKAKKKKGKSLDLTESEPSTEPASEVTKSAVEPIAEPIAEPVVEPVAEPVAETVTVPSTEESLETSNSAEVTVEEPSSTVPDAPLDRSADLPTQSETVEQINDEPAENVPGQAVADETQSADVTAPGPASRPIDDLSAPKLSKKDKKKKKKGKLQDESNPLSGTATPTVLEPSDPLADTSSAAQDMPDTSAATILSHEPIKLSRGLPLETSTTQEDSIGAVAEEIPLSSDLHSSKATANETALEAESSNSTTLPPGEADLPPVNSTPVDDTLAKDAAVAESALPATPEEPIQAAPESAIAEPEEEFPTATKKSKKDKKKNKGKSAASVLVEPEELTPSATGLEQNSADDVVEAKEAPVLEAEIVPVPAESAPTEISTKTNIEAPAEAYIDAATTAPVESHTKTPAVALNDASAEAAAESPNLDDDFPTVQKKSKKDKKKKGKFQDDSELASGTVTPAEVLDAESQAKQFPDVSAEPAEAFRDADQPAIPSTPEPTTYQDQPQTEDHSVDETLATTESPAPLNVPTQEVENVVVTEPQPPAEEEWPVTTPAKKSKKDKKKNRKSKASDDLDMGSATATPLEATAEEAKEVASSKDITTREEASTSDNKVATDLPVVEPPVAATVPEVSAQDLVQEVEEPRSPVHGATQEQHIDEQPDASTKSETLTLEPGRTTDEPVVVEEPQEFVVKKSKKDKKKTKSALVESEPTVPATEESSAAPEDLVAKSAQEPSTAELATETPVTESVEDITAPAEEWPEAPTSKKNKKNKKKQSLVVEPEVVAEAQASSTSLGTETQTTLLQDDQTAKSDLPEAPVDTNSDSRALTNEPGPVSEHGPEIILESTPGQQLQIETIDVADDNSSSALPLGAQPTIESREVGEAAKAIEQEPAVETGPSHSPREAPTTPAEEWPEVATTKKSKKDRKKKKRQSLSFDDAEADSPLASGTTTPKVVLTEEEAASKAESGTSHEAPADGASSQPNDVPFEQPAAKENVVTTGKSAEPLESSEPISTSEIPVDFNKIDEVTSSSQRELDQPHAVTEDTQVVEPVAQQVVDDMFASANRTTEPITPNAPTASEYVGERGPAVPVVLDVQTSAATEEPEDNSVVRISKDKKKKRASQVLLDEPAAPVLETTEISEPHPVIEQVAPEAISEETSQETRGMDDVPQEPVTEEFVTNESKKDKKSARLSSEDEPETPLGDQTAADTPPMVESSMPFPESSPNVAKTATEAGAAEITRSFRQEDHQTPAIPAAEPANEPAAADDDEWDLPVTKKSKKGKKSKKQSISHDVHSGVSASLESQQDPVAPGPELNKFEQADDKTEYFDNAPRDITRSPTVPPPPEPAAVLESPAELVPESAGTTVLSSASNKSVGVDLTPAQETSSVVHELPFNQPGKRKKMKTRELSNTLLPEPIVSSREIAAAYLDSGHETPADEDSKTTEQRSLPTPEPDTPRDQGLAEPKVDEDASQKEPNILSARDMAASYIELKNDQMMDDPIQPRTPEKQHKSDSSGMGTAAGVVAAAAGAAVLASKSSSAKKKKGKKSKYEDKRASQEEDMFDDPSLWEGADRKHVSETANAEVEDFWGSGGEAADYKQTPEPFANANVMVDDKSRFAQRPPSQDLKMQKEDDVFGPTPRGLNIYSSQPQEVAVHSAQFGTSPAPRTLEVDNWKDKTKDVLSLAAPFKEKAQDDNVESPILGREPPTEAADGMAINKNQEHSLGRGAKTSKTNTMVSDMDEAVDRGFEAEARRDLSGGRLPKSPERSFEVGGFRSPVPTILPPVQEEAHEGAETEHRLLYRPASRTTLGSPDPTRDSGFVTGSPHPFRRSGFDNEEQRDSGVHLREWQEQRSPGREGQRTPELRIHRSERRRSRELERAKSPTDKTVLQRSPFAEGETRDHPLSKTPVLREPTGRELTPEPQKYRRTISPELERKRSKYQDLASAALAGAAISSTCSSPRSTPPPGNRSVSDRVARLQSPAPTEPVARRSMSNSSLSRHRRAMGTPTPEPLKFRPESPGIQRSGTATPPLRRVDRRVSGDLRSLSQRSQLDLTKDPKDPTSSSNTPVANEGRVRTKDMADVYVS
ncbi:hypothetical protein CSPAE12_05791, partial [Colletotrichum incanum]